MDLVLLQLEHLGCPASGTQLGSEGYQGANDELIRLVGFASCGNPKLG
jgi:hypothetical protein